MQAITLRPIDTPLELMCPHCDQPIYRVLKNDTEVIRGGWWLRDGDTIPGLHDALSDEQQTPNGFDYELLVGSQACCGEDYYVVECRFINAVIEGEIIHFFETHLTGNKAEIVNYIADYQADNIIIPSQWIVTQASSPRGIIHSHLFGPFPLLDEDFCGRYGVMALNSQADWGTWMHGRHLLLTLWNDLRELTKQPSKNLNSVQ